MRFLAVIIVFCTLFIGLTESFQASLLRVQHRRSLFLQETSIPNEIIVEPISPIPTLPTSFNIGGLEIDRSRLGIIFTSITSFLSLALSDFVVQCLTKRVSDFMMTFSLTNLVNDSISGRSFEFLSINNNQYLWTMVSRSYPLEIL